MRYLHVALLLLSTACATQLPEEDAEKIVVKHLNAGEYANATTFIESQNTKPWCHKFETGTRTCEISTSNETVAWLSSVVEHFQRCDRLVQEALPTNQEEAARKIKLLGGCTNNVPPPKFRLRSLSCCTQLRDAAQARQNAIIDLMPTLKHAATLPDGTSNLFAEALNNCKKRTPLWMYRREASNPSVTSPSSRITVTDRASEFPSKMECEEAACWTREQPIPSVLSIIVQVIH